MAGIRPTNEVWEILRDNITNHAVDAGFALFVSGVQARLQQLGHAPGEWAHPPITSCQERLDFCCDLLHQLYPSHDKEWWNEQIDQAAHQTEGVPA